MSENLRRLREEAYTTDKGRKWTLEEEAKRIARERKKEYAGLSHWHKRYEELSGMSKIIDLERKAEEARKEEQQVKEKLRREREEILNDMRKLIAELIEDENDAATTYKTLSEHARGLDLQNIERQFVELSRDEERHRIILRDIQSILSRTR